MRVIVQRVKSSAVSVESQKIGEIGIGLNLLVGVAPADTESELDWITRKCLDLRLFADDEASQAWSKSIVDIQGEILVVSQFTLYGDCRKGRRPSFQNSAAPEVAKPLYDRFVYKLRESGLKIVTGQFGAMMEVEIVNDGPVTFILDRNHG